MSFASLLNDTCTIFERVETTDPETGQELFELKPIAENVACGFQNGGGSLDRNGRLITATNSDTLFLFPQDFEISKQNHVVEVRGVRFRVSEIMDLGGRKKFLSLSLERTALDE